MIKKLPYGISDYERIITNNYYYVDKTKYIEILENLPQPYIMFLRPRKFGKTLFTSTIENYYDIKKKDEFEKLYKETYIGKHPTALKNSYHILKFNFSGIDSSNVDSTISSFKKEVGSSIRLFAEKYGLDFCVNMEDESEWLLSNLIKKFLVQMPNDKIYVIIDGYDNFANELLEVSTDRFKDIVLKTEKIIKWYEILKEGTEKVIYRIFITGEVPISLDSLTSGFNICCDMTQDEKFNEMLGFTENELLELMINQNISPEKQNDLLPIMKENYGGYRFSVNGKEKIYNPYMCLYFLNYYLENNDLPRENIANTHNKIARIIDLCKGKKHTEIIEKAILGEGILSEITQKFNPAMEFTETDLVSMLYYLGYLTIVGEELGMAKLKVPNQMGRSN